MIPGSLKYGATISFVIALCAFLYKKHSDEVLQERLRDVLSGLLRAEKKVVTEKQKVAVAFGACEDIFADSLELLDFLNISAPTTAHHHDSIESITDLTETMAYFFQHGAAAERYLSNRTLFNMLVDAAFLQKQVRQVVGGNAPAIGKRLSMEGLDVMLGGRMSKSLAGTLPKDVKVIGEFVEMSDTHLILEYKTGESWGKFVSPRANRFIVHADQINPFLDGIEDFIGKVVTYDPALIIIGGLQMMDNFPFEKGVREARLTKLRTFLQKVPKTTHVHFEMASFTDEKLLKEIIENVVVYSDSLGMNEQELPNLVSILEGGNVTLVSDSYPRVATVLDQMRLVYNVLSKTKEVDGKRKVTRIHVHTLAFQAILTTMSSSWKNTMSSAAKAALTAHRYTCGEYDIDTFKARLIMDESFSLSKTEDSKRIEVKDTRPVACWQESDYDICVSPVLVCTKILQTAGGGDNVSAAGLVLQV